MAAIVGQAEPLCRFIPNIDSARMDGIYLTTNGVTLKLSALRYHCQRFKQLHEMLKEEKQARLPKNGRPIGKIIEELSSQVPLDEWAELPADGAEQHDHYLYGSPKRDNP
jgi:hypothetical protein